jgi:hypothetical protein
MTQVAILLLCMATAPPVAGRVVSGPGLRPGQAIGRSHVVRAPTRGGPVTLLTTGGCLVHLSAGAAVTLGPPTKTSGCSTVRVIQGRVRLGAPGRKSTQPALTVVLGKHTMTLTGEGIARHGAVSGLCVNHGKLRLITGPKPPPTPTRTPAPTPTPTPSPSPMPSQPSSASAGQCLWLTASGATLSAYKTAAAARDQKSTAMTYGFATPRTAVIVDLKKELASLSAALHSGSGGGSDVDGGGQSMCLDTGGEGSAADLGSSAVEVTKPPPPTQLRLLLDLKRRTP